MTTGFDNDVRLSLYRFFVEHERAPVPGEIARVMSVSTLEIEQAFRRLAAAHVLVLAPGTPYIWMANPLSALPTPFVVRAETKTFWGNCIWDALGVLAMLHSDGSVSTSCPDCGDELRAEVAGRGLVRNDLVVHIAVPAARWWDDIGFN